jgi:hypothetical protein
MPTAYIFKLLKVNSLIKKYRKKSQKFQLRYKLLMEAVNEFLSGLFPSFLKKVLPGLHSCTFDEKLRRKIIKEFKMILWIQRKKSAFIPEISPIFF